MPEAVKTQKFAMALPLAGILLSVPEMPLTGENHRQTPTVGCRDRILISQ
jgi:hypothetical protein